MSSKPVVKYNITKETSEFIKWVFHLFRAIDLSKSWTPYLLSPPSDKVMDATKTFMGVIPYFDSQNSSVIQPIATLFVSIMIVG